MLNYCVETSKKYEKEMQSIRNRHKIDNLFKVINRNIPYEIPCGISDILDDILIPICSINTSSGNYEYKIEKFDTVNSTKNHASLIFKSILSLFKSIDILAKTNNTFNPWNYESVIELFDYKLHESLKFISASKTKLIDYPDHEYHGTIVGIWKFISHDNVSYRNKIVQQTKNPDFLSIFFVKNGKDYYLVPAFDILLKSGSRAAYMPKIDREKDIFDGINNQYSLFPEASRPIYPLLAYAWNGDNSIIVDRKNKDLSSLVSIPWVQEENSFIDDFKKSSTIVNLSKLWIDNNNSINLIEVGDKVKIYSENVDDYIDGLVHKIYVDLKNLYPIYSSSIFGYPSTQYYDALVVIKHDFNVANYESVKFISPSYPNNDFIIKNNSINSKSDNKEERDVMERNTITVYAKEEDENILEKFSQAVKTFKSLKNDLDKYSLYLMIQHLSENDALKTSVFQITKILDNKIHAQKIQPMEFSFAMGLEAMVNRELLNLTVYKMAK